MKNLFAPANAKKIESDRWVSNHTYDAPQIKDNRFRKPFIEYLLSSLGYKGKIFDTHQAEKAYRVSNKYSIIVAPNHDTSLIRLEYNSKQIPPWFQFISTQNKIDINIPLFNSKNDDFNILELFKVIGRDMPGSYYDYRDVFIKTCLNDNIDVKINHESSHVMCKTDAAYLSREHENLAYTQASKLIGFEELMKFFETLPLTEEAMIDQLLTNSIKQNSPIFSNIVQSVMHNGTFGLKQSIWAITNVSYLSDIFIDNLEQFHTTLSKENINPAWSASQCLELIKIAYKDKKSPHFKQFLFRKLWAQDQWESAVQSSHRSIIKAIIIQTLKSRPDLIEQYDEPIYRYIKRWKVWLTDFDAISMVSNIQGRINKLSHPGLYQFILSDNNVSNQNIIGGIWPELYQQICDDPEVLGHKHWGSIIIHYLYLASVEETQNILRWFEQYAQRAEIRHALGVAFKYDWEEHMAEIPMRDFMERMSERFDTAGGLNLADTQDAGQLTITAAGGALNIHELD